MAKKKKIREEFESVFKSGNDKKIKIMLEKHPWLLSEISNEMDDQMLKQHQIIGAIGVMEDELGGAVSMDKIIFCLNTDFNIKKNAEEIQEIIAIIER